MAMTTFPSRGHARTGPFAIAGKVGLRAEPPPPCGYCDARRPVSARCIQTADRRVASLRTIAAATTMPSVASAVVQKGVSMSRGA